MPTYAYRCELCNSAFEEAAGRNDRYILCGCGGTAERRPFTGVPAIKGETVARAIPDAAYRTEREKRDLKSRGWDADRSLGLIRRHMHEEPDGERTLDVRGLEAASV
jgi:putative FmdB family regulatory protein